MTDEDNVTVIEELDGKRRVEETREVHFDSGDDIVWLQGGDVITHTDHGPYEKILEIGDGISDAGGIHARTQPEHHDADRIVHLNIIRAILDENGTFAAGERTRRYTQVEGTDK